jgi:methionyl-tRNA formyltransferase
LRLVFAGTPAFASTALAALHAAGHDIALVLTRPDKPAGRGMRVSPSDVGRIAGELGIATFKPPTLRDGAAAARLREASPDAIVVAAYGLILPAEILAIPRYGCINIHASLLPRWRGGAPIPHAPLAGDQTTGVSIMQMDAGLDTGPVLMRASYRIDDRETGGSLTQALAALGAETIVRALADIASLKPTAQAGSEATYAPKIDKAEARIDWRAPNVAIDRLVRAFHPAPGAETLLADMPVKIWEASPAEGAGTPGEILACDASGVVVACGRGALRLVRAQRAGSKPMAADALLRGARLAPGARFGSAKSLA